jgi:hypothetical protein
MYKAMQMDEARQTTRSFRALLHHPRTAPLSSSHVRSSEAFRSVVLRGNTTEKQGRAGLEEEGGRVGKGVLRLLASSDAGALVRSAGRGAHMGSALMVSWPWGNLGFYKVLYTLSACSRPLLLRIVYA